MAAAAPSRPGSTLFWFAATAIALSTAANPFVRMNAIELGHLTSFQDDFFYYLTIARNIATHGRSTFDFITDTNGYHPLWMALLAILAYAFDPRSVAWPWNPRPRRQVTPRRT